MKNQYIGDIGDYGKYGLLRYLKDQGIRIGVNWYLTPFDGRTDGIHREYLDDTRMRRYDSDLFDTLGEIAGNPDKSVALIESSGILKDLCFYNTMMSFGPLPWTERTRARSCWHQKALDKLNEVELVFADPDNGLSSKVRPALKNAQKYILPCEIVDYFKRGQQIMYYQHKPRKNEADWMKDKTQIRERLPESQLLAVSFNRWNCRTFIFVLHEEVLARYREIIDSFLESAWGTYWVDGRPAFAVEEIRIP